MLPIVGPYCKRKRREGKDEKMKKRGKKGVGGEERGKRGGKLDECDWHIPQLQMFQVHISP